MLVMWSVHRIRISVVAPMPSTQILLKHALQASARLQQPASTDQIGSELRGLQQTQG